MGIAVRSPSCRHCCGDVDVFKQVELQQGLEQAQLSAHHLRQWQAARLTERGRMPGLAASAASLPASTPAQSDEQQDSQGTDSESWRQAVEGALQNALDLFDADRTVRAGASCQS